MRFRSALALLAALTLTPWSQAQTDVDWQRYSPLEPGNVWEYAYEEVGPDRTRYELLRDTVALGRAYVLREVTEKWPGSPASTYRDLIRYDDATGTVVAFRTAAEDTGPGDPCSFDAGDFVRDLRLAIGTTVDCPPGSDASQIVVEGELDTQWTPPGGGSVDVAAIKTITVEVLFATFVADIGPVGAGNLWGPRLAYARIDGVEYGTPYVFVSEEEGPEASGLGVRTASPIRSGSGLRLSVRGAAPAEARVEVFDALGRRVARRDVTVGVAWRAVTLPVRLASGAYRVRLAAGTEQTTVPLTVVR